MKLSIPISVPPMVLRPNGSRGNPWSSREARRKQRAEAKQSASIALAGSHPPGWKVATYRIIGYTLRRWDDDNLIAALKGARDGIADAGVVADDKGLRIVGVEWIKPDGIPKIVIEVEGK